MWQQKRQSFPIHRFGQHPPWVQERALWEPEGDNENSNK